MDLFFVLADPARRRMLDMLLAGERAANDFVRAFPEVSQPAVSQHLKVLREAGLVEVRAEAQRRLYSLRPERLREVDEWIGRYRRFWMNRLEALEDHLNRNPRSKPKPPA
jgi:DNA-binding transcriptional ArsR family regulator